MSDAADAERDRTSGWTGGQYSLYRVLLAVGLAGAIATGLPAAASGLSLVGGAAALAPQQAPDIAPDRAAGAAGRGP